MRCKGKVEKAIMGLKRPGSSPAAYVGASHERGEKNDSRLSAGADKCVVERIEPTSQGHALELE